MSSTSRLQRKRDELQKQYDLLSEKIVHLRAAHAIEASAAVRFQLEKQIEQAESDRQTIEQQIDALDDEINGARQVPPPKPGASVQDAGATPQEEALEQECLTGLRRILDEHFNDGELRTLCFDLDVDYDDLPGTAKADKARELINYLKRRKDIPHLVRVGKQQRPDISWCEHARTLLAREVCQVPKAMVEKYGQNIILLPKASMEYLGISDGSVAEVKNRLSGRTRFAFAYSVDRVCDISISRVLRVHLGVSLSSANDLEVSPAQPRERVLVHEVCKAPESKIREYGQNVVVLSSAVVKILDISDGETIRIVNRRNGREKPVVACSMDRVCEVGTPEVLRHFLGVQPGDNNELELWRV